MTRAARAIIDLGALQHNLRKVRDAAPGRRVMAVIKANAYGHGMLSAARALSDADAYAVACLDEAMVLREAGINKTIVLLEGFFSAAELPLLAQYGIAAVIHHDSQLRMLEQTPLEGALRVWLKVDSGMHRLGFAPEAVKAAWQRLKQLPGVSLAGFMTHFASADERGGDSTRLQLHCFNQTLSGLAGERSLANSAAILAWPDSHGDWLRPGIMLYGVSPFAGQSGAGLGLKPVMRLQSQLIAIHPRRKGERIGYGGDYTCPEDMSMGVVAIGYGDGYPRHAQAGTPLLVNGRRAPLIARVSMDMVCVDLRGHEQARCGDPVILWGDGLPVEEVAAAAGTIAYELLCRVTPRVRMQLSAS